MTLDKVNGYRPVSHYRDTGCKDAGVTSCLDCPLPKCVEDMTFEELKAFRRERHDSERVRVIWEEGLSVEEAASKFGITQRTVWRIIARSPGNSDRMEPRKC